MAKAPKKGAAAAVELKHYDVVRTPHITEKATLLSEQNAVVFKVANKATKPEIKAAVEALFDVSVVSVGCAGDDAKPEPVATGADLGIALDIGDGPGLVSRQWRTLDTNSVRDHAMHRICPAEGRAGYTSLRPALHLW